MKRGKKTVDTKFEMSIPHSSVVDGKRKQVEYRHVWVMSLV